MSSTGNIPSIALARMVMHLAESRAAAANFGLAGFWTVCKIEPCTRDVLKPAIHPLSAEYYRIIDRLTRGERP